MAKRAVVLLVELESRPGLDLFAQAEHVRRQVARKISGTTAVHLLRAGEGTPAVLDVEAQEVRP